MRCGGVLDYTEVGRNLVGIIAVAQNCARNPNDDQDQKKVEPRARVELATCRLRIGCSTTELPRPALKTITFAEKFCQFRSAERFPKGLRWRANRLAGKGVHGPADAHAYEYKEEEGPQNVFYAVDGAAAVDLALAAPSQRASAEQQTVGRSRRARRKSGRG